MCVLMFGYLGPDPPNGKPSNTKQNQTKQSKTMQNNKQNEAAPSKNQAIYKVFYNVVGSTNLEISMY